MAQHLGQQDTAAAPNPWERIAQLALSHYHTTLPLKGKPKPDTEWTVFAAIVAISDEDDAWVVSSATGTKCCPIPESCHQQEEDTSLCILRDSHAEVLARRGLVRVLAHEMLQQQPKDTDNDRHRRLLERADTTTPTWQMRSNISLHLYISDSPCGDASIYDLVQTDSSTTSSTAQFTGAKVIVSQASHVSLTDCGGGSVVGVWRDDQRVAREAHTQLLGKVRSKAGRSNLPPALRSRSMSCSDKLVRWSVLGLQGALLQQKIRTPIRFTSIVMGQDARSSSSSSSLSVEAGGRTTRCQLIAAHRIAERVVAVQQYLQQQQWCCDDGDDETRTLLQSFVNAIAPPAIHLSSYTFTAGKSSSAAGSAAGALLVPKVGEKRKRKLDRPSPAGLSINWQCTQSDDDDVELTVGARGMRQGKKPRVPSDVIALQSRLSRHALLQQVLLPVRTPMHEDTPLPRTTAEYAKFKRRRRRQRDRHDQHRFAYETMRATVLQGGPLAGWLIGDAAADTAAADMSEDSK